MKKFPLFADSLFFAVCTAILSFCILRFYDVPLGVCFSVSVLLFLSVGGICLIVFQSKRDKKLLSEREKREKQALLLHLTLEKEDRVRSLLAEAYRAEEKTAREREDAIEIDGIPYYPRFSMQPLSADVAATLLRANRAEKFGLLCNALSPECAALLLSFEIPVVDGEEIYALLKRTQRIPERLICGTPQKRTVRKNLRRFFGKKNSRPFFISGILLLLMSLFAIFPLYYLISGCALMTCALFVRAFGYA